MTRQDIPNLISILRILLTIPVAWLLLQQQFNAALVLFAIAGVSDGLDGFLAKRYGWESRLGGLIDPLADKALLVLSYLSLAWLGLIPLWLALVVVLRDVVIVLGALVYHFRIERLEAQPSLMSKINTCAQILLVVLVVMGQALFEVPAVLIDGLVWLVLATTVLSGAGYVWDWSQRAARQRQGG